ncbi:T9SS type A sorting domain-containing protein [Rhodohalobacter sulfatireducens]|uniref:T9SS type A sorting domain-containing protein n=1 Tax=Rhodohalobacter sulfatireducens TaxID=2911366 RepID=A0ABS9KC58_9BACT|nr:T9SS type A sorting domain-containing protein [Rhodohalobacter sulfatireducens]MCG2588431.1 T9SS type A sorting domain-containing protein [Rhodohalobacter sulfatireducens]
MKKFFFGYLILFFFNTSLSAQVINNIPPNEPNTRFTDDLPLISMRPGLSIAGFSNEGKSGLGLAQILNNAAASESSSTYQLVTEILDKAKEPISLNPETDQIEYTTNILQYMAFEALASVVLEQNGINSEEANSAYGLNIREHSSIMTALKNALTTLTKNDKLARKIPGNEPFDDYLNAIRSYSNTARALDLYLAIENAYQHYSLEESFLLNEQEKKGLMNRFRADIDILFNEGLKREYSAGDLFSVTEDNLEAGNRPLKGYLALAYASMSAQATMQDDQDLLDGYITTTRRKASEPYEDQRGLYWMYQTANGSRFWAEGPFYFDFVLKDAIIFWHAIRINEDLDNSFDPFFNDWFLNPVRWLADLSTPDGSLPPLDDSNKRPIQSANLLRWNEEYGDSEIGNTFSTIFDRVSENHGETFTEDQFYLVEAAIPINDIGGSEVESQTYPAEQQLVLRHTDRSNRQHYLAFVGEKGEAVTSGEGHEQPDQLQLLYYIDEYSFLVDGGYDSGNPQTNSTWNGYQYTNTMQYNASNIEATFDFVTYQNEGGLESPFASIAEARKVSEHDEAEIDYQNPAPNVELLSGKVELNFESPTESSSTYHRSILFVKGEDPYLVDINDITAVSGRNDFVMRYYGNSNQTSTNNDWFFWDFSDQSFTSPTHRLFLFTVPLSGNYFEENETVHIQEAQNRINGEKQPYPVIRKSYLSEQENDRFATASILKILENTPTSEPEFVSNTGGLSYLTYPLNSETIDLFVFAADTSENDRLVNIQSGPLNENEIFLRANQNIGFSRFRIENNSWVQDSDFTVNMRSSTAPDIPNNLTVSIEDGTSGPAAVLMWDEPGGDISFYEIWKQLRERTDQSEQPAEIVGRSETNSFSDTSINNLPLGEFEQRWFVKAVNSDSLVSLPSDYTDWIYIDPSAPPEEFKLFNPFPNPMQETGNIRYQLAEQADVKLQLFDLLGREIKLLFRDSQTEGSYIKEWDTGGISSGIYILRLSATSGSGSTFQKSVMVSVIK